MRSVLLVIVFLFSQMSLAIVDGHEYQFTEGDDQQNQTRAQLFQQLAEELRCPKCQNQNLADSNAMIAGDLRRELYQQVKSGQEAQDIIDFMVNRYGEFVLYRPQMNAMTYVLWFGPVVLLLVAVMCLILVIRKRKQGKDQVEELTAEQQQRLNALLGQDKGDDHV
ncbi:MAG: cytochrome c-type biogenesis protein CcmH [Gammaproteobacteria bacterium]|nr:cytochrome c-type biogenesis protein CcmH [Gammaproteobacteria bacterium]